MVFPFYTYVGIRELHEIVYKKYEVSWLYMRLGCGAFFCYVSLFRLLDDFMELILFLHFSENSVVCSKEK